MNLLNETGGYRRALDLLMILAAAVVVTLPIFLFGIPSGNDMPQHYQFAQTFYSSLQHGVLYPSWADATNFGFGDVGIRFYPPFSYYVMCLFRWVAGNWYTGSALTFCFWFLTGAYGIYYWSREWFDASSSLAGAIAYLVMPYHVNQIYNAFLYAEFAASAILPFCFLFVTRICRGTAFRDVVGLAVSYSFLLLTNLPMAVIGSGSLLIYALCSLRKTSLSRSIPALAFSAFLGLLASGFYLARMITELGRVRLGSGEFFTDAYDFHSNFLLSFLYVSADVYVERSLWFSDLMLTMTFAIFVPSAILYYRRKRADDGFPFIGTIVLLAFALLIAMPISLPIWEAFGTLQKIQFPWRWLAVISILASIFVAAGFRPLVAMFGTKARPFALAAGGLMLAGIVFTATQIIRPALYLPLNVFAPKVDDLRTSESCECLWPVWSKKVAFVNKENVSVQYGEVEVESWRATERMFKISSGREQEARIGTFYYPHWRASVNETVVDVKPANDGTILVPVGGDAASVRLWFEEPTYLWVAVYVSTVVWVFFAAYLLLILGGKYSRWKTTATTGD